MERATIIRFLCLTIAIGLIAFAADVYLSMDQNMSLFTKGANGMLLFLAIFIFVQPIGIPGFVFVVGATVIWPPATSFALSLFGGWGASIFGFFLARIVARDWLVTRIPMRFEKIHRLRERADLRSVVQTYFLFYMAPPVPWVFGLSTISVAEFAKGSFVGLLPGTAIIICIKHWMSGVFA